MSGRSLLGQCVAVHKCDAAGRPVITYHGTVTRHDRGRLVLEAVWSHGHCDLGLIAFEDGDCFAETYYFMRWWNAYEVHSPSGELRGWYCNIARPARLMGCNLYYDDLALDVLVAPSGRLRVVDRDEFHSLYLGRCDPEALSQALRAVRQIRALVAGARPPFRRLSVGAATPACAQY